MACQQDLVATICICKPYDIGGKFILPVRFDPLRFITQVIPTLVRYDQKVASFRKVSYLPAPRIPEFRETV